MKQMKGWTSGFYKYRNIKDSSWYIEVVTYKNDGHFYYKKYTQNTYGDYKLERVKKKDLLQLLKNYVQVE